MINRGHGVTSFGKDDCQKHDNSIQMYTSSVKMRIRRKETIGLVNRLVSLQLQVSWIDFQIALLPHISRFSHISDCQATS